MTKADAPETVSQSAAGAAAAGISAPPARERGAGSREAEAPLRPAGPRRLYYRFCQFWCRVVFLLFFRGRTIHLNRVPRTGGVLLASNHQSFLDPVLVTLAAPREFAFMGRDTLFNNPRFRRLIESLNCFPVRRGSADVRAIKESLRRLRAGYALVAFPEGTRTSDGTIGPMLPGMILIARRAGVPIVPTLIQGAYEAWPRTSKFPRPRPITVVYDEPLHLPPASEMSDEECVRVLRGRLLALQQKYDPVNAARQAEADARRAGEPVAEAGEA
jgi:1-acyl-sn-glycerol-3-phosphate acyltransferase